MKNYEAPEMLKLAFSLNADIALSGHEEDNGGGGGDSLEDDDF